MKQLYKQTKQMELLDYQNLKNKLETISNNHTEKYDRNASGYLDPCFISINMYGGWRLNKKVGCEKSYEGWNFFSTSANSNGYDLYEKIKNECKDFKLLLVTERQL